MLISLDIGFKLNGVLGLLVAVPIAGFINGTLATIRGTSKESMPTKEAEAIAEVSSIK